MKFQIIVLFKLLLIHFSSSRPTSEDFNSLVTGSVQDFTDFVEAKSVVASVAANATVEAANYLGSSISTGADATIDFVTNLDPIEVLDDTQSSIIINKEVAIEAAFDAKKNLVESLQAAKEEHSEALEGFYNATLESLSTAISATQDTINATTVVIGNIAQELSLANAKENVASAFESTQNLIAESATALLNALVDAKLQLHNAAINVDSQSAVEAGIDVSVDTASNVGVFSTIDSLIQSVANAASKLNPNLPISDEQEEEEDQNTDDDDDDDDDGLSVSLTVDVNSNGKEEDLTDEVIDQFSDELNEIQGVQEKDDRIIDGTALLERIEQEAFENDEENFELDA